MRHLRPSLYRKIRVRRLHAPRRARRCALSLRASRRLARAPSPSQVVMSDGATFHVPSAVRMVSKTLQLERDPANHPIYLVRPDTERRRPHFIPPSHHAPPSPPGPHPFFYVFYAPQGQSDQVGLMSRREEARLQRFQRKNQAFVFDDE